ncbi:MAG: S1 RNA-binding domain-containing protein [Chloroflexota bacterium]
MSEHEAQIVDASAPNGVLTSETTSESAVIPDSADTNEVPTATTEVANTDATNASPEDSSGESGDSAKVEADSEGTVPAPSTNDSTDEDEVDVSITNAVANEVEPSEASEPAENKEPVVEEVTQPSSEEAADSSDASSETPVAQASGEEPSAPAVKNEQPKKEDEDSKKKVVRVLSVGQNLEGTVKRLTDFGAFVDIGVGRDGLLHISELSLQRVNKVGDVLSQGQEVSVWIKELNREKNRISLTMISPDTKTIRDINKDDILEGTVTRMMPYGAFIDIGIGRDALLHVREMAEGYVKRPEDVVSIGEKLEVRILEVSRRRGRVDLSIKGLRPEPELEEPEEMQAEEEEADDALVDEFEDVEPMSAMELALKRAMEGDGGRDRGSKRSRRKSKRSRRDRDEFDDIISRTLNNSD